MAGDRPGRASILNRVLTRTPGTAPAGQSSLHARARRVCAFRAALAGTALLCEGSTIREGKYRDNIKRAVEWLMDRQQPNGLLGVPSSASEGGRYMYGHGFAVMFLACIVGEEDNAKRREKL